MLAYQRTSPASRLRQRKFLATDLPSEATTYRADPAKRPGTRQRSREQPDAPVRVCRGRPRGTGHAQSNESLLRRRALSSHRTLASQQTRPNAARYGRQPLLRQHRIKRGTTVQWKNSQALRRTDASPHAPSSAGRDVHASRAFCTPFASCGNKTRRI